MNASYPTPTDDRNYNQAHHSPEADFRYGSFAAQSHRSQQSALRRPTPNPHSKTVTGAAVTSNRFEPITATFGPPPATDIVNASRQVCFVPTNRRRRRAYIVPKLSWVCRQPSHRRRPSPRCFRRERLERRGPGPLCGPVLFRQPGRRCMLNGRTSSWSASCHRGVPKSPFRIGSVDAVGGRRTSIDRRSSSRCFLHSRSHGRASRTTEYFRRNQGETS
jgi:hypothetical protein